MDMNETRFTELADAFGGDIDRWPDAVTADSRAWRAAEPDGAARTLGHAASLDRLLNLAPAHAVSPELHARIMASAPRRRGAIGLPRRWAGVGVGAGLLAASMAGIMAGVLAAPVAAPVVGSAVTADAASEAAGWLGEPADAAEG